MHYQLQTSLFNRQRHRSTHPINLLRGASVVLISRGCNPFLIVEEGQNRRGCGNNEQQPFERTKGRRSLELRTRILSRRAGISRRNVYSHGNEPGEPREGSHDLGDDTNVANYRAASQAGLDEVEDDNQNRPGGTKHQEAPRSRDADVKGGVAAKDGVVDMVIVATKRVNS